MLIQRLKMRGFGSFADEEEIVFQKGVTYIVGENLDFPGTADSNGCGKTTILDAICLAINGSTPSGRKKDATINRYRDESYLYLHMGDTHIERKKTRGKSEKLRFRHGVEDWSRQDYDAAQRQILEDFGVPFETFCNALYLTKSSKTVRFLEATPSQRGAVLAELVDDWIFRLAGDKVGEKLKETNAQQAQLMNNISSLQLRLDENQKTILKLELQVAAFNEDMTERKRKAAKKVMSIRARMTEAEKTIMDTPDLSMEELQTNKENIRRKISDTMQQQAALKQLAKVLSADLEEGTTCPTCQRVLSEDDAVKLGGLACDAEEQLEHITDKLVNLNDVLEEINQDQQKLRDWRAAQKAARQELKNLQDEYQMLQDELAPASTKHLESLVMEKKALGATLEQQLKKFKVELATAVELVPVLKDLKKGFSTGIRNMLYDKLRGDLEYYSNYYLDLLAGNELRIKFPGRTKSGIDKFDILLTSDNKEQGLECYSEGETWRATFSSLLALRRILLESQACSARFLLVDDPIGALDETGARKFIQLLQVVSEATGTQIICTVPRLIEGMEKGNTIHVTRRRRVSRITA